MDLISVIIPVYNREKMIQECLNSVLNSEYRNLEVIVIDDGSTDGTLNVCRRMQESDERIKIYEGVHSGVSSARNIGLDNCNGDYVFFVDSDDVIHKNLLTVLHDGIISCDAQISATGIISIAENNWRDLQSYVDKAKDFTVKHLTNEEAIYQMFRKTTPINLIGGVLMSRELIGSTRFREDLFIGEDFYFIYENIIKGCSVIFTKSRMYYCRIHNNSSFNYSYEAFLSRFKRRVLVWQSEEKSGRLDHAVIQKTDAFGCYTASVLNHKPYSEEAKKIRKTVHAYKKELSDGLGIKIKLLLFLSLHAPLLFSILLKRKRHSK